MQFHTGFGDADLDLLDANPLHLRPLHRERRHATCRSCSCTRAIPTCASSATWPRSTRNVYADVGLAIPHLAAEIPAMLRQLLGLAPASKVLYSSDASADPRAVLARRAMGARGSRHGAG